MNKDKTIELRISPYFTIDDIHKVREYTYEVTKHMTAKERTDYIKTGVNTALKEMAELKKMTVDEKKKLGIVF